MRDVIGRDLVEMVFQPIVDLRSRRVVGYEALARGPAGSSLESPAALFSAARAEGHDYELDLTCRVSALREALRANVHRDVAIFINVEPRARSRRRPRPRARRS